MQHRSSTTKQQVSRTSGQTLLIITIFFLLISMLIILGVANPVLRHQSATIETRHSKQSYFLAESLMEDMVYRHLKGMSVDSSETLDIDGYTATGNVTDIPNGKKIVVTGDVNSINRNVTTELVFGDGITFNFGVQVDEGGLILKNSASVIGNAFANGPIVGDGNDIYGSVISAGPNGLIEDIHATSSAYAHSIKNAWIEGDAFYSATTTITNTIVEGNRYPGSPDQSTTSLPISDEQVQEWQDAAELGGVATCSTTTASYEITSDESLGPIKIPCDLEVNGGSPTITIGGPIWVEGDISIRNQATFEIDSSFANKSVAVIADDPNASSTKGVISLENNTTFNGSGNENSYILFLSQNTSAEEGGTNPAITVANSATGDILLYAGHGRIVVQNFVTLKEITAYTIEAQNSAEVIYESGLANLLFDAGPSGGLELYSWLETDEEAN